MLVAAAGGVVLFAGFHPQYGQMLELDHGNDLVTRYAHCSRLFVKQGDVVPMNYHFTTTRAHFEILGGKVLEIYTDEAVTYIAAHKAADVLAGVPSIVFGLFGLGFFINFIGKNLDALMHNPEPVWGQPALIWASLTLAVMTLPVVIVATEESLKAIPQGLREASLALGATKLETILKIVLPQALPGIMTGAIIGLGPEILFMFEVF